MNKAIMLLCALALARAAYPITATKAYVDGATNATLAAAKAYTDTVAGVTPTVVTNIAGRVTSNVVTKAYVEALGISGGGITTNDVNAIIASSNLASVSSVELKRDKTDRVWTTAGFTPWTATGVPQGWTLIGQPYQDDPRITWRWDCTDDNGERTYFFSTEYSPTATSVTMWNDNGAQYEIVASRQLVPADNLALTSEISSSAFTNAGAVVAATNSAKSYADATFLKKSSEWQPVSLDINCMSLENYLSVFGDVTLNAGWGSLKTAMQSLPTYLDSLDWRTTGNRTLANYGIANAYTKSEINGTSVTNGGAKAYADANFLKLEYVPGFEGGKGYDSANFAMFYKDISDEITNYFVISTIVDPGITWFANSVLGFSEVKISVSRDDGFTFSTNDDVEGDAVESNLTPDNSPVATSNMVERVVASKPAPSPLTGKTYDFANGVNFTKNLYTALTNVIQTLGGTVTNPPNFTP